MGTENGQYRYQPKENGITFYTTVSKLYIVIPYAQSTHYKVFKFDYF